MKQGVYDIKELKGKRVLLRADFNVPLAGDGEILDDTRIRAEVPTIKFLVDHGAKVIIVSHLGRPKGYDASLSLFPVSVRLMKYFPDKVKFSNQIISSYTKQMVAELDDGEILLLENIRFEPGETECSKELATELASLADVFVNDAFGVIHRKHASNFGVAQILPTYAGFLVQSEVDVIENAYDHPKRPLVAIFGGAKVADKLKVINRFLEVCDTIIIGGAMSYTFLVAKGVNVGDSLVSIENIKDAKEILDKAQRMGKRLLLPVDHVVLQGSKVRRVTSLEKGMTAYDIGKDTIRQFIDAMQGAGEIIWNGPLGMYEDKRFCKGTFKIAKAIAKSNAYSVVGGGDSVSAINACRLSAYISHVSTGGGASLKLMEGAYLPALEIIKEKR